MKQKPHVVMISAAQCTLIDHGMVAKRVLYENAARVPLLLSGKPLEEMAGTVDGRIAGLQDVMPTLLDACGIEIPESVEGESLLCDPQRDYLYGEISEGDMATRMIRKDDWKLIYYPVGNLVQLFNLAEDSREERDRAEDPACRRMRDELEQLLISELYSGDEDWVGDGKLVGLPDKPFSPAPDFKLNGQRGGHWPPPV
jgi:arylsulfatase